MRHHKLAAVIGHRGVPYLEPENSLAGLRKAAKLGHSWCEIDSRATADGIAVVHHDARLKGKDGRLISRLTHKEVTSTAIGKASDGNVQYVPDLVAALKTAKDCKLGLVVEIKSHMGRHRINAESTAMALRSVKVRRLMVASFSVSSLRIFKKLMPEVPLALNVGRIGRVFYSDVCNIHFDAERASARSIHRVIEAGYGAYAYTVNDKSTHKRLASIGVHGVFSDNPATLEWSKRP